MTAHQVIPGGFLCLTYGAKGIIANICGVRTKGGEAVGQQLYLMNDGEYITCKTANGLSGQSFSNGVARWGTVYDDDGPPDPGEAISKEEWAGWMPVANGRGTDQQGLAPAVRGARSRRTHCHASGDHQVDR